MGHDSEIFALAVDDDLRHDIRPFADSASQSGDVTIFHFALPSPMSAAFAALPHGRVLQYHNVTPARFFAPTRRHCSGSPRSRVKSWQAWRLQRIWRLEILAYNRQELDELGFTRTAVMPIAVDTDRLTSAPRQPVLEEILDDGLVNFLFVGRIAPNKKIEDHIKLAEQYKRYIDAYYRFIFVGRYDVVPRYYAAIRGLLADYQMLEDRFIFTGPVHDAELAAYYRASSVYVSLSEHEGFCVPLVEAMAMDVPVLAYSAAAVPDTLGGAGVQFAPKDLEYVAELLGMLAFEESPREEVLAGQRRRLQDFAEPAIQQRLASVLSAF